MAEFKPSWSDSFKFDGGSFGGGGGGSSFGSSWNPGSGGFSGIGSDSESSNKGFNLEGDPFGLGKDKEKKQFPWEDAFRAAGKGLEKYGQDNIAQGKRADGLTSSGGLVAQGENFMVVQGPPPTILPPEQSTFSKVLRFAAPFANAIPGAGPFISAGMGAASNFV